MTRPPAAILDIDGTLVDTNYHHAVAWFRAFRRLDVTLPLYRIHRHIGMGGDQLVAALAGDDFEREHGDEVRALEGDLYMELIDEVRPLAGARELMEELGARPRARARLVGEGARGRPLPRPARRARARRRLDDAGDVERTKPSRPRQAAVEKAGGGAVMVGDSTWDCEAAAAPGSDRRRAHRRLLEQELRDAARGVFERLRSARRLDGRRSRQDDRTRSA